jgi:hypothetical protein
MMMLALTVPLVILAAWPKHDDIAEFIEKLDQQDRAE